ncbi:MAG: hypothetical protein ACOX7L_07500 [Dethiobacteria bacterium]|jgi:hypothetical protein
MTKDTAIKASIEDIKEILTLFGKLSDRDKELALASLKGMTLVTECNRKEVG